MKANFGQTLSVNILHLVVLCAFAFAQPLYDLLSQHVDFFIARRSTPSMIMFFVSVVSILVPLIFVVIATVFALINMKLGFFVQAVMTGFLSLIIVLPWIKKIDGCPDTLVWCVAFLVACSFGYSYRRFKQVRSFLTFLAPAVLIFPILFLFSTRNIIFPQNHYLAKQGFEKKANIPVVMVIFDEIATPYLMNEDRRIDAIRYPNFASLASQSYWFRHASTVVHNTTWAVPSILSGLYPTGGEKNAIFSDYPNNLFILLSKYYQLRVFESATALCPDEINNVSTRDILKERIVSMLSDISVIYLHFLLPKNSTKSLPNISQNWGNFVHDTASFSPKKPVGKNTRGRPAQFRKFLQSISKSFLPTFNFVHILIPHPPVKYLPSGKTYGYYDHYGLLREKWEEDDWPTTVGFQRYLLQLGFADLLLGELLTRLKDLDVFEQTLIVVVADHGISFKPGSFRRNLSEDNFGAIGPVPLFFKLPNQKKGVVSDIDIEIVDILPSIADLLNIPLPKPVEGYSFFGPKFPRKPIRRIMGCPNKKQIDSTVFKDEMYGTLREMLALFGSGQSNPEGLFKFGPHKDLIGRHIREFPIIDNRIVKIDISKLAAGFEDIDLESDFVPSYVHGDVFAKEPLNLAISLNGIISGVSKTFKTDEGKTVFFALVPPYTFRSGRNQVNIFPFWRHSDGTVSVGETSNIQTAITKSSILLASGQEIAIISETVQGALDGIHLISIDEVLLKGWAIDKQNQKPVDKVLVFLDGYFVDSDATRYEYRGISEKYGSEKFEKSGFRFRLPRGLFRTSTQPEKGERRLQVFAVSNGIASQLSYSELYSKQLKEVSK